MAACRPELLHSSRELHPTPFLPHLPPPPPSLPLQVDVALITHFHLDHCAAVPYLLQKTKFKV